MRKLIIIILLIWYANMNYHRMSDYELTHLDSSIVYPDTTRLPDTTKTPFHPSPKVGKDESVEDALEHELY